MRRAVRRNEEKDSEEKRGEVRGRGKKVVSRFSLPKTARATHHYTSPVRDTEGVKCRAATLLRECMGIGL
jgi:hypothetical protein